MFKMREKANKYLQTANSNLTSCEIEAYSEAVSSGTYKNIHSTCGQLLVSYLPSLMSNTMIQMWKDVILEQTCNTIISDLN